MKFYLHFEPPAASDQPSFTAIVTHDPAGPKVPTVSDVLDDFSGRYARKHGSILPVSRLTLLTADGAACHPHRSAALSVKTGDDVFVVDAGWSQYDEPDPAGSAPAAAPPPAAAPAPEADAAALALPEDASTESMIEYLRMCLVRALHNMDYSPTRWP